MTPQLFLQGVVYGGLDLQAYSCVMGIRHLLNIVKTSKEWASKDLMRTRHTLHEGMIVIGSSDMLCVTVCFTHLV